MTVLDKTIRRELGLTFDRRKWIAELHSWGIEFHAKREKKRFSVAWHQAIALAIRTHVDHERYERQQTRKRRTQR